MSVSWMEGSGMLTFSTVSRKQIVERHSAEMSPVSPQTPFTP